MRSIFFCRHFHQVGDEPETELRELMRIRARLASVGFCAKSALSSTAARAISTARFLARGTEPRVLSVLHAYSAGAETVRLAPNGSASKQKDMQTSLYVSDVMNLLLRAVSSGVDAVVVSHDAIPLHLAARCVKAHGGSLEWDFHDRSFPERGEGVLVRGGKYELFRHD